MWLWLWLLPWISAKTKINLEKGEDGAGKWIKVSYLLNSRGDFYTKKPRAAFESIQLDFYQLESRARLQMAN